MDWNGVLDMVSGMSSTRKLWKVVGQRAVCWVRTLSVAEY